MKISYYTQRIVDCKRNTKKLWKTINAIICKYKHSGSVISYITIEGVRTYNPLKIANAFGKFYSTLVSTLAKQINPGVNTIDYYLGKIPRNINSMVMHPTSQKEIEQLITKLPNKTSHGHDMISNKLLKSLCKRISLPLSCIFNQLIAQGIFPDQMKIAEVVPLYKGKSIDELVNYRPISLLLTMSKLLEKIIYKRLIKFIDKHKILYKSQYGFHSKRSCEQAMLELIGKILQNKNNKQHSSAIFLDLSKAFDTLNHNVLIQKLEIYGIQGICRDWFVSYLENRSLVCKLNTAENSTVKSQTFNVTYGAGQGSCLGPLLFILFANDIHLLEIYGHIILFVDDTTLLGQHKNLNFLKYTIEHDMKLMLDWFNANQLSLNLEKTVLLKFWSNDKSFEIKIQDQVIKKLFKNTKFLGITTDENLTWNDQANVLYNKVVTNKCLLMNVQNLLPGKILEQIYYAHVYSHITYGLVIWGSMLTKRNKKKLARFS